MKKMTPFLVFTAIFFLVIWFTETNSPIMGRKPIPTEFVEKKSKRKDFKQQRKEYMQQMHRAHPDADWKKMDADTRKMRTDNVRKIRQELFLNRDDNLINNQLEQISRNLSGVWNERGSNNLSGRIRTSEIDWENGLIYCASDGGNIWRGSLSGDDWSSLTDYLQIKGIHFLRLIEFEDTRRLLFANGDNLFFTDDEGVTLQLCNGIEFLSGWEGNYLKRVIITEDKTIYLLATEGTGNWNAVGTIYKSTDYGRNFNKIITLDTSSGMSSNQNSDHYDIWTSRYFESDLYLIHNDEFYQINSSDQLEFVSNIPISGSGENILTGGMGPNYPFLYAHVGSRIFYSMNGGNSWVDRGERPQWYFNLQNSFNSSNIDRDLIYWGGM